ncbi:hypothetical protein HAX54_019406 [Datura stramonium]|uniref:Uncharacterized protein n=1 Tax=Datura stramonium TaxID=4076 RepID=A0ABS8S2I8_DATST|nr:hypothetical protein [Datura stramonium]
MNGWDLEPNADSTGSRLEMLNYDNTPIIYFDEALENHEVDSSSSFLVVTTRNGKVVHAEPHMIVEKEIHDAKNLLPEFNEAPKEISDEATSEKVNEECKDEAQFPLCKQPIPYP